MSFLLDSGKDRPLPEIFAQYADVEIPYKIIEKSFLTKEDREKMTPKEIEDYKTKFPSLYKGERKILTEEGEKIVSEIYKTASDNNVNLRLCTPSVIGTMDVQHSRLNIHVKEETDGKWRVQNTCNYG